MSLLQQPLPFRQQAITSHLLVVQNYRQQLDSTTFDSIHHLTLTSTINFTFGLPIIIVANAAFEFALLAHHLHIVDCLLEYELLCGIGHSYISY